MANDVNPLAARIERHFVSALLVAFGCGPQKKRSEFSGAIKHKLRLNYPIAKSRAGPQRERPPLSFDGANALVSPRPLPPLLTPGLARTRQKIRRLKLL